MNEAVLKAALVQETRVALKQAVVFRHEDKFTHGIPDMSVTFNRGVSWWEAKYATPKFVSRGIQELTMLRLNRASFARYVVYWEVGRARRTYIIDPSQIGAPLEEWDNFMEGFNHTFVVDYIRELHK
jgi:hypothetical protein